MLYIIIKSDISREIRWWNHTPIPNIPLEQLVELQADGDELNFIKNAWPGIVPNNDSVNWYGDLARSIWKNCFK